MEKYQQDSPQQNTIIQAWSTNGLGRAAHTHTHTV